MIFTERPFRKFTISGLGRAVKHWIKNKFGLSKDLEVLSKNLLKRRVLIGLEDMDWAFIFTKM